MYSEYSPTFTHRTWFWLRHYSVSRCVLRSKLLVEVLLAVLEALFGQYAYGSRGGGSLGYQFPSVITIASSASHYPYYFVPDVIQYNVFAFYLVQQYYTVVFLLFTWYSKQYYVSAMIFFATKYFVIMNCLYCSPLNCYIFFSESVFARGIGALASLAIKRSSSEEPAQQHAAQPRANHRE